MSMCEGWRIWQHNYNPNIRYLVPKYLTQKDLLAIERGIANHPAPISVEHKIPIRTPMHPDLDIHEVTLNQTVDAGTFPAKGLLEYYHPEFAQQ